jgi:hypothetical protein
MYVRTVLEDTGEVVPDAVITGVRRIFENSVDELSGGRLHLARFESGIAVRNPDDGLILVGFRQFIRNFVRGDTVRGGAPGTRVTLVYDSRFDTDEIKADNNARACESVTVATAEHEAVHVMGFYHTSTTNADFHTADCSGRGRPERVQDTAQAMYARPLGNTDPDFDPAIFIAPPSFLIR